jgi:DNA modification methylase
MTDDTTFQDFITKYARPYNQETDDYDCPPFATDIKEGKNDPIYNVHSYHTKVPPRGIVPYILHYTEPGDLVLDPFCGSGMTGVATLMCANPPADLLEQFPELKERVGLRRAVLNDLSPAACHIAYNYTTPVDVGALKYEFERIQAAVEEEFARLYGTEHYEPAIRLYDPKKPEIAERLKNPTVDAAPSSRIFKGGPERTWELIDRVEVERRLGYAITDLPRDKDWGDIELSSVKQWICIPATIQYTIWSDVYRCEGFITIEEPTGKVSSRGKNAGKPILKKTRVARGCTKEIVLKYASFVHGHEDRQGSTFTCTHCKTKWQKSPLPWIRTEPVEIEVLWLDYNDHKRKYTRPPAKNDHQMAFKGPEGDLWFPSDEIYQYRELMTMGAGKRSIKRLSDFYLPRQLRALATLFSHTNKVLDDRLRSACLFAFTAIVNRCSLLNRLRPSGAGDPLTGTLYIGSLVREDNVGNVWGRKIDAVLAAIPKNKSINVMTRLGDAANLYSINDNTVDFVFADPPFGGNIFYADASILWEGWLQSFTDVTAEMVLHRRSRKQRLEDGFVFKSLEDYADDMRQAFSEIYRVLKVGRWAVIEFNNSDGAVFEAIKNAALGAGFTIVNMLLLDKEQKSFKQVQGSLGKEDVVDKDVVFNLCKPVSNKPETVLEALDIEHQVAAAVRDHLMNLPIRMKTDPTKYNDEHRTTATINSMVMNTLIPKGIGVERLNLQFIERVCRKYFRKVGQRWYLRGEAVGIQNGSSSLIEEEVAIKDEVSAIEWIRQRLKAGPMLVGELKPLWMRTTGLLPAEVSQNLVLDDLLAENFWHDADTNRWREPTDEERERMNDDRSIRVLHDTERFVAGTLRQKTTDAERCEWIDILFQVCKQVEDMEDSTTIPLVALRNFDTAEGYRLISRLFQSVLREAVTIEAYRRAEKQARVASQRFSKATQEDTTRTGNQSDSAQMTLDWNTK